VVATAGSFLVLTTEWNDGVCKMSLKRSDGSWEQLDALIRTVLCDFGWHEVSRYTNATVFFAAFGNIDAAWRLQVCRCKMAATFAPRLAHEVIFQRGATH